MGRIVNFGSAAMLNSTYKKVKAEADKVGIATAFAKSILKDQ